ncbi:hypothetical protein [Peribacillus simplex]|uniref:hypothetical protein n=1 Tax=Peribacillus simplex TaxID=1478 RepID=UPI001485547F|nr:hypothetical protein [Peribacillus simplex]
MKIKKILCSMLLFVVFSSAGACNKEVVKETIIILSAFIYFEGKGNRENEH